MRRAESARKRAKKTTKKKEPYEGAEGAVPSHPSL